MRRTSSRSSHAAEPAFHATPHTARPVASDAGAKRPAARAWLGCLAFAALLGGTACQRAKAGPATGEDIYQLCVRCHGADGGGKAELKAPAIAGLPEWYIKRQLDNFRKGIRGGHADDFTGMQMRPMATSLRGDAEVEVIAKHVAAMQPVQPAASAATQGADLETGAAIFGPCVTCHGEKAAGNEEKGAPPLTRTNDWYLVAQLQKFKDGHRGANPEDAMGAQMVPFVASIADDQTRKDVVAHILTLR